MKEIKHESLGTVHTHTHTHTQVLLFKEYLYNGKKIYYK